MKEATVEFHASVEHLSSQGLGTVRDTAGRIYFVRAAWPGDKGVFRPTSEREGRYQFAELLELTEASQERRPAPCPHFGVGPTRCYGCPWIIAEDRAQEKQKWHRLAYAFERVGLDSGNIRELWTSPQAFAYRSRVQLKTDGAILGYAGLQGQAIAPIESCLTLSPRLRTHVEGVKAQLPRQDWHPTPPHIWNFIEIDEESDPRALRLNRRRPFQQANKLQNERMRDWVSSRARGRHALELFAGSGNFTDVLARDKERLIEAFEVGEEAVRLLQARQLPNVSARRMDLYDARAHAALRSIPADLLVVNPPRAGMMSLTRLTRQMPQVKQLLYISCDIQTLLTDLQKLLKDGFQPIEVQPVDQMPQTPHLEVLVRLERP